MIPNTKLVPQQMRKFSSPKNKNNHFSQIVKPKYESQRYLNINTADSTRLKAEIIQNK